MIDVLERIWAVLLRIALGSGAYPARHEPAANYGLTMRGSEFTAPGFNANTTKAALMVDLLFEEDRTLCVEWQADWLGGDLPLGLPYGEVEVEYVVGGARRSRVFYLTNRYSRCTVTARQLRVTCQLSANMNGSFAPLSDLFVNVSASEGRAGMKEDYPLQWESRSLALVPRQFGTRSVIRWASLYTSVPGLYLLVFLNQNGSPGPGAFADYAFGTGAVASPVVPVSFEINSNTWFALSTNPIVYAAPVAGAATFYLQQEQGFEVVP